MSCAVGMNHWICGGICADSYRNVEILGKKRKMQMVEVIIVFRLTIRPTYVSKFLIQESRTR
jgi:hypothetical protein